MCRTRRWLIAFDIMENVYHIWSIIRHHGMDSEGDVGVQRQRELITTSLMLREFVEISAPAQFALAHVILYWTQARSNGVVCTNAEEFSLAVIYLLSDLDVELVIGICTYAKLRTYLPRPLRMLRGSLRLHLHIFLAEASFVLMY